MIFWCVNNINTGYRQNLVVDFSQNAHDTGSFDTAMMARLLDSEKETYVMSNNIKVSINFFLFEIYSTYEG